MIYIYQPTILTLPREILHAILVEAMQARFQPPSYYPSPRLARALRLRHVCKLFNALYKQALFETRILDIYQPELYHSYLAYRVKNESNPAIYRYVEVRRIAESVCRNETDLQDTIDALCWLGLGVTLGRGWSRPSPQNDINSQDLNLLSAADFVGNMTVVRRLLESGTDPTQSDGTFPSAIEAAALAGNFEILEQIQESLPDVIEPIHGESDQTQPFIRHYALSEIYHKGKADIQGVVGAAMNGDLELLEMALYPPSRANNTGTAYFDYTPKEATTSGRQEEARLLLEKAQFFAKNWEVYSRLASLLPEPSPSRRALLIRVFAEYGNFNVVKNLLDDGCHVDGEAEGKGFCRETPLYLASRFGNSDIVNLLLERGANVDKVRLHTNRPLLGAIRSSSINIARKLLEYGAKCYESDVVEALFSENEEMIDLLLGQGPQECLHAGWGYELATKISGFDLDSMLELLHDRGYFRYVDGKISANCPPEAEGNCEKCGYSHKVSNGMKE